MVRRAGSVLLVCQMNRSEMKHQLTVCLSVTMQQLNAGKCTRVVIQSNLQDIRGPYCPLNRSGSAINELMVRYSCSW